MTVTETVPGTESSGSGTGTNNSVALVETGSIVNVPGEPLNTTSVETDPCRPMPSMRMYDSASNWVKVEGLRLVMESAKAAVGSRSRQRARGNHDLLSRMRANMHPLRQKCKHG